MKWRKRDGGWSFVIMGQTKRTGCNFIIFELMHLQRHEFMMDAMSPSPPPFSPLLSPSLRLLQHQTRRPINIYRLQQYLWTGIETIVLNCCDWTTRDSSKFTSLFLSLWTQLELKRMSPFKGQWSSQLANNER